MQKNAIQHRLPSLCSLVLILITSGCAGIRDFQYDLGQKIRTHQAWNSYNLSQDECFTLDYRDGWKEGYFDVLTGGDGVPPVIAPRRYWKAPVFVQHDPSRREDWYCGYQDGAACAKTQPDFHYLKLWLPDSHPVQMTGLSRSNPHQPGGFRGVADHSASEITTEPALVSPPAAADSRSESAAGVPDSATAPHAPASEVSAEPSDSESGAGDQRSIEYESDPPGMSNLEQQLPGDDRRISSTRTSSSADNEERDDLDRLIDSGNSPEMVRTSRRNNQGFDLNIGQGNGVIGETSEINSTTSHRETPPGQWEDRRLASPGENITVARNRRSAASRELSEAFTE